MRVLVGCETSGKVRDAFRRRGHDAWSCDLLASDSEWHYKCDLRQVVGLGWDLLIAHPPCTFLASSGLHWNKRISTHIRKPDQIIHPWMFGEDASKATCLWLENLPCLVVGRSCFYPPRIVKGKRRWGNQTDSGQNKLGPSALRWKLRSETYGGVAEAMASQWGSIKL